MRHLARYWIGSFLIALLVLTGHSMAIARGHTESVAGQIVICAGTDVTMVYLDAAGNPTETPRYCPDGVLSLFDFSAGFLAPVTWTESVLTLIPERRNFTVTPWSAIAHSARDPPFVA